jgi:DNA-binding transcriptional regulator YiaG
MTPEEFVKARELLGLTRRKAAVALGVAYSTVCAWESGQNKIPKIAEKFICILVAIKVNNQATRAIKASEVT